MLTKIELIKADITKIKAEAIVNAANKTLLGGGGVDGAIHRTAGPKLLLECALLKGCGTGQAKITKGYNLTAKYVIHVVGPVWHGGNSGEDALLASCYISALKLAKEHRIKTIAFPSISTGAYGFPKARAARIVFNAVTGYIKENPDVFEEIIFVLFSDDDLSLYKNSFFPLLREKIGEG